MYDGKLQRDQKKNPLTDWFMTVEDNSKIGLANVVDLINQKTHWLVEIQDTPLGITIEGLTEGENLDELFELREFLLNNGLRLNIDLTPMEIFKLHFEEVVEFDDDSLNLSRVHYTKDEAIEIFTKYYKQEGFNPDVIKDAIAESSVQFANNDDYVWESGDSDEFLTWCID